jgi:hypothetical protein
MRTWIAAALLTSALCAGAQAPGGLLEGLTRAQDYEARRASSSNEDLARNGDARPVPPGETLVLADLEGPGVVTSIWCTMAGDDPFIDRSVVFRVHYDGAEAPSVQAPIGDFFGLGNAAPAEINSAAVMVASRGRAKNCFWRMPFKQRIRITVTNDSPEHKVNSFYYYVNWQKHDTLPDDTVYFHAHYRQEFPAQPGNYEVLRAQGRGHYVGTVLSAYQMETGWLGEGDDFFFIDGAELPQLRGTGTEDYFLDAWGYRRQTSLYAGVPIYEGVMPGDRVSTYRWHLPDPIPFRTDLRFEIEHRGSIFNPEGTLANFELGTFEERPDWVSSVAFWYQDPPAALDPALPPAAERVAPYRVLRPAALPYRADPPFLVVPADGGVTYVPNQANARIEFDLEITEPGHYQITGQFLHALMGGVYQASLNGVDIGAPLDFVINNADPIWIPLDTHQLEPGTHTLRFQGVDATPPAGRILAPKFHGLGLNKLLLLRLEDMQGYREVSNRLLGR